MKKSVSLLLTVVVLATMLTVFAVPAFAEEELCETIKFSSNTTNSGGSDHCLFFTNGGYSFLTGWTAGSKEYYFTVHAIENPKEAQASQLQIKRVELHVTGLVGCFEDAQISGGRKVTDGCVSAGDYVSIDDIHDKKLTIGGSFGLLNVNSGERFCFDEIRVYFEKAEPDYEDHEIIYYEFKRTSASQNFILYANDTKPFLSYYCCNGSKMIPKVYTENSKLQIKSIKIRRITDGAFVEINNIHSQSFTIPAKYDDCYSEIIVYYEPVGTGSVLSNGSLWIVIAVAVLAIGTVAAVVIVKKKKPALASGTSTDDEE